MTIQASFKIRGTNCTDTDLYNTVPPIQGDSKAKKHRFNVEKNNIKEEWSRLGFDVNPLEFSFVNFIKNFYSLAKPKEETFSLTEEGF